jgi:hypothetical protein
MGIFGKLGSMALGVLSSKPARVTGKALVPVAALGGVSTGAIKIFDYLQDVKSKSPVIRQKKMNLDLGFQQAEVFDALASSYKNYIDTIGSALQLTQGGNVSDVLSNLHIPTEPSDTTSTGQKPSLLTWFGLGIAAVGVGYLGYQGYKRFVKK